MATRGRPGGGGRRTEILEMLGEPTVWKGDLELQQVREGEAAV